MSKIISDLLNAKEPDFSFAIRNLEHQSGHPGADIRLAAEIKNKAADKIASLGLDPKDTTGQELYHALKTKMALDSKQLAKLLEIEPKDDYDEVAKKIIKFVKKLDLNKTCWVIKRSVAKDLLKKNPPKKIMRVLKYKSVDSLAKNANIFEVMSAIRFAESPEWQKKFVNSYQKLTPHDFETRNVEVIVLERKKWASLARPFIKGKKHNLTHLKEMGVVAILPKEYRYASVASLTTLPLVLHYINEIKMYSSFFKLQQVKPDFGKILVETITADFKPIARASDNPLHWRVIQRYFGKLDNEKHPEIFQPHLQPEDLHWRKAEKCLFDVDEQLAWWDGLDYVGYLDGDNAVSLNFVDNVLSFANNAKYNNSYAYHLKESLWNELFTRYMGEETLEKQIMDELDSNLTKRTN